MAKNENILRRLAATIGAHRDADPVQSYVATLFAKGDDAIIKKIGEEATEAVMAAKDGDKIRLTAELADLWFHCLGLLVAHARGPRRCWPNWSGVRASPDWRRRHPATEI